VNLVVPIKRLDRAKSRLRGAVPADEHAGLVLAMLLDTVTAATQARGVSRVLVICEDERIPAALTGTGVESVDRRGLPSLNAALRFGAEHLGTPVGALQADLPALRPDDLAAAIEEAAGRRAYCADRAGTGTTLLLAAPGAPLDPRFGRGSAAAHAATGAVRVGAALPSLRCDVDTPHDLAVAAELGLGSFTEHRTDVQRIDQTGRSDRKEREMSEAEDWNAQLIAEFRANEGRVGGDFEGAPLVLLHHRGRKSGREYVTPVMYLPDADDDNTVYVFASKGGAPSNPEWYYNLTEAGDALVERGTERYRVTVRELSGADRDRTYAEQVRRFPGFGGYEEKTAGIRTIPVLELRRA